MFYDTFRVHNVSAKVPKLTSMLSRDRLHSRPAGLCMNAAVSNATTIPILNHWKQLLLCKNAPATAPLRHCKG
jgi:hypothetical protein